MSHLFAKLAGPGRVYTSLILGGVIVIALVIILPLFSQAGPYWAAQGQASFAVTSLLHTEGLCTVEPDPAQAGFFLLLGAGFLTGLSHCVGMCGPLVGAFVMRRRAQTPKPRRSISTPLVLFQMGRLTTYMLLGAAMGAIGELASLAALLRGGQGLLAVILGGLLVVTGLGLLGWLPTRRWLESMALARLISQRMQGLLGSEHPLAPFGLGLTNGLLPCGAVYAMSLLAMSAGSPLAGAMIMLIFGLGTLPAMLGLGFSMALLGLRPRRYLFQLAALLVVLMGLQLALRGLALSSLVPHIALGGVMLW